ncbi:energy transducer TonB [Paracandidimonas soli]|uniref:energy transducer TonB n=1 Tax=Paracandidimonas soli TaxID=1917182 RepID=UPI0033405A11
MIHLRTLLLPSAWLTPRNDYLRIALLVSAALHALALTVHLGAPSRPAPARQESLEVTLVNAHTETAPVSPTVLAQQQIDGGGEDRAGVAATPLPRTATQTPDEMVLAAMRRRQEQLEAEQARLYTQLLESVTQVRPERKQPDLFSQSRDAGTDLRNQESLILNARIAAIKERIEQYNAQPRRQFTGPAAARADHAQYVENWRQSIEQLGTQHYPEQARGQIYGSLQLTVHIRKDGALDRVEIDRPSEHAILNLAAQRIVQLAAPFPPLPASVAEQTDILAITRTWHFVENRLDTTQ